MKTNMLVALACGAIQTMSMQKLNAQVSYTAIDIRPSVAGALGAQLADVELFASGINGNGVVYGYARITDETQLHGFVWGMNGGVSVYRAPDISQESMGGDMMPPSYSKVVGVSLAGEVAVTTNKGSYIKHPSGSVSEMRENNRPLSLLWMNDNGSAAVLDADRQMYGAWRADGVSNGMRDVHPMFLNGNEYRPVSIGSDDELYGISFTSEGMITSYRSSNGGVEINLFGTSQNQATASSLGVMIGVRHPAPDRFPTTFVLSPYDVEINSDTVPYIEALVKDGNGVRNLQSSSLYAIPFAISPNGLLSAGVTFNDVPSYRYYGEGEVALWRGVEKIDVQVNSPSGVMPRDGIGITNSALALSKAIGADGNRTVALLVPTSPQMVMVQNVPEYKDRFAILSASGASMNFDVSALEGKRVIVTVHGWAPGYAEVVGSNPEIKSWNANAGWYFDVAKQFNDADTVVLGYSWLDGSATDSITQASRSRANTDVYGETLYRALKDIAETAGSIELVAHSHGSRVALFGAYRLEESGINVSSITMLDSPETPMSFVGGASSAFGGENSLASLLSAYSTRFGIGNDVGDTKVANIYSSFGEAYVTSGVTNVKLVDYSSLSAGHSYPIEWFSNGGIVPNDSSSYVQDLSLSEYSLRLADIKDTIALGVSPLALFSLEGNAWTYVLADQTSESSINLSLDNSDWSSLICLDGNLYRSLDIEYSISDIAEDSLLSFWIDDTNVASVISGGTNDEEWQKVSIPVRGIEGLRRLSASLSGSGTAMIRSVDVSHTLSHAPEPTRVLLILIGSTFVLWQRRRNGAALPLKIPPERHLHFANVF